MSCRPAPQQEKLLALLKAHPEGVTRQMMIDEVYGGHCAELTLPVLLWRLKGELTDAQITREIVYRLTPVE